MSLSKIELDNLCHALERYIAIYGECEDLEVEKKLLSKLIAERWN